MSVPRRLGLGDAFSPDQSSRTLKASHQAVNGITNHPIRYNEDGTLIPSSPSPANMAGLYSPKPSPSVRVPVASPAPATNAPPPPNYSMLPALDHTHRYVLTGTLQQSLFGVVKLAFDRELRIQVAVKISRRERAQQQQTRSGVSVLENVKREAAVMRYVYERSANQLTHSYSQLNGLSTPSSFSSTGKKTKLSSRALQAAKEAAQADAMRDDDYDVQNGRKDQTSLASDTESPPESDSENDDRSGMPGTPNSMMATNELEEGENYIARFIDELEDEHFHYLITEFVPAGDLYSMLTSYPQHRLTEPHARVLFRQMVLATQWLHSRNIAHLDLSLENMCLDVQDNIRLIDFGVAAIHPFTSTYYSSATSYFKYPSPTTSVTSPIATKPGVPLSRSFMCKPVKELYNKPGKLRYMSPELFQGQAWDAYANDVFSLGVILYSLLTGRPPFQQAEQSDVWFHVIYSGQWLTSSIRKQPSAHVYTHLSENALDLVNRIIKPQELRPTTEQILQHPWMLS